MQLERVIGPSCLHSSPPPNEATVSGESITNLYLEGAPIIHLAKQFQIDEQIIREIIENSSFSPSDSVQSSSESSSGLDSESSPTEDSDLIECSIKSSKRVIRYEPEMADILTNLIQGWNLRLHEVVRETGRDSTAIWTIIKDLIAKDQFKFAHRGQWEEFMEVNTDFLDQPSDFRSYFMGLMVTDGWVTSQVQNANTGNVSYLAGVGLTYDYAEEEMLQRLGNVLGIPLRYDKTGSIQLANRQQAFTQRIMAAGIEQCKSLRTVIPPQITDSDYLPFLLGVIDGDGGPYLQSHVVHFPIAFKICGASRPFMEAIADNNHRLLHLDRVNVHAEQRTKKTKTGETYATMYTVQYNYADTVNLYRALEKRKLLPLGLQNKMPIVSRYIRSQREIQNIKRYTGNPERQIRAILQKAHPHEYLQRVGVISQ